MMASIFLFIVNYTTLVFMSNFNFNRIKNDKQKDEYSIYVRKREKYSLLIEFYLSFMKPSKRLSRFFSGSSAVFCAPLATRLPRIRAKVSI